MQKIQRATELTPELLKEIEDLFAYHPPTPEEVERMGRVRETLRIAFCGLITNVPPSPTRSRALDNILDSRMLGNQAIIFKGSV